MFYRDPVPEDIDDLRRFLDDHFRRVEDSSIVTDQVINELSIAAYGVGEIATPYFFPITTGWQTVPIDVALSGRGMKFDTTANTFNFDVLGFWRFSFFVEILTIDELNASRTSNVRAWNITQGVSAREITFPISRNQGDILVSPSFIIEVTDLDSEYRMEIGGGDPIANGTLDDFNLSANVVSELQTLVGS